MAVVVGGGLSRPVRVRILWTGLSSGRPSVPCWVTGLAVLDAGCGNGSKIVQLADEGAAYAVGVDISGNFIPAARVWSSFKRTCPIFPQ